MPEARTAGAQTNGCLWTEQEEGPQEDAAPRLRGGAAGLGKGLGGEACGLACGS